MVRACGIVPVDDATELVDTAALLTEQPLPAGSRLAVIGNAGGLGVIAADQAHDEGLEVVPLPPEARERIITACGDVAG